MKHVGIAILALSTAIIRAQPTDLVLHLKGSGPVTHLSGRYRCDATGASLGLPAAAFTVKYIQSGDTSLAIVPVKGEDLVFAQVLSASGGRYVAGRLTWWDAKEPTFRLDADRKDGGTTSYCKSLN